MKSCEDHGHNIGVFVVSNTLDPVTKTLIPNHEVFCSKCGKDRAAILKENSAPPKRTRSPKKPAQTQGQSVPSPLPPSNEAA
jgi:hypothetical protein